jgi:serine/threonine protein kinase
MTSPSIITCKDKIIKYSNNNIIFYENGSVYKQFPFDKFKWVNEIINVNALNHPNIIQFKNCEIVDDFIVDSNNREIYLDQKEKVVRITMNKYNTTLDRLSNFTDTEIMLIFDNILRANIHCNEKKILHRDVKESNILINYKEFNEKRIITDVILADFNISKYRYDILELNKYKIMTITHRPPEISSAILNNRHCSYDERIDVWSICIVLTYLITGQSFYEFLTDGYLTIDPMMLYDTGKIIIALRHFIKIYTDKNLKHLRFYIKIIFMGIKPYECRSNFNQIFTYMKNYISKISPTDISRKISLEDIPINNNLYHPIDSNNTPSPVSHMVLKKTVIFNIHTELQNNSIVIEYFYKFYTKMLNNNFEFSNAGIISLYIFAAILVTDESVSINKYISVSNKLFDEKMTKNVIELMIIKIIKFNEYSLY